MKRKIYEIKKLEFFSEKNFKEKLIIKEKFWKIIISDLKTKYFKKKYLREKL